MNNEQPQRRREDGVISSQPQIPKKDVFKGLATVLIQMTYISKESLSIIYAVLKENLPKEVETKNTTDTIFLQKLHDRNTEDGQKVLKDVLLLLQDIDSAISSEDKMVIAQKIYSTLFVDLLESVTGK